MLKAVLNRLFKKPYQPRRAVAPQWDIVLAEIDGEFCDPENYRFVIAPTPSPERAIAHALAHLDLAHHESQADEFTEQECVDADDLAQLWLDEFNVTTLDGLPSHDGPPTVIGIAG
jgi:hypothetical protein